MSAKDGAEHPAGNRWTARLRLLIIRADDDEIIPVEQVRAVVLNSRSCTEAFGDGARRRGIRRIVIHDDGIRVVVGIGIPDGRDIIAAVRKNARRIRRNAADAASVANDDRARDAIG